MIASLQSLPRRALARIGQWAEVSWRSARAEPGLALLALLVTVPCLSLLAVEVRSLWGDIYDVHEWRQGETYSVAYSFVHEGSSFFFPRHAWRGNLTGIVGMEAPLYPYVVSLFMRIFGDSFQVARSVNFGLFLLAFGTQWQRLHKQLGLSYALGYLVMVAFCPAALCEFRQMQPDPATASLTVLASVFMHDHGSTGARKSFAWGLACYTLALLTKPIAIAVAPAMYLFSVLGSKRPSLRGAVARLAWFIIPLGLMFLWDWWARELVNRYMGGQPLISIEHDPRQMWIEFNDVGARRFLLLGLVETYTSHVSLFPAVLLGIAYSMRKELRSWGIPFVAWLAGAIVIAGAFSARYPSNWYYMLPFVPPLVFFGALGLGALFDVLTGRARDPVRTIIALSIVLAAVLIVPQLEAVPWEFAGDDAGKIAIHTRRNTSGSAVYWAAIVGAMVAAASLQQLFEGARRLPQLALTLALSVASAASMVIPYKDLKQVVRFYTKEDLWQTGRDDLVEIRATVARYSTPRDLFVMNGYHPALLVRALRVGWADDPGTIQAVGAARYASMGARFFMSFWDSGPVPQTMQESPVLARGARWELRCIDPKGCPVR
ncbi:MAG: putative dolichyl-phosphate-mannose-protein mannosyltransferase [Myxococcaceae bacterium]|nr:putative dolichyl-phosphate-mannose-protein mannosyltransferase [Myxococcaceae bacterium]